MGRGKRLSRSNIIGREGQTLFEQWALRNGISTTEADTDIGIDYFCQVLSQVEGSASLEGTGASLAVQVKSTASINQPKFVLNRIDAEDLLRQKQATCVIGVHVPSKQIYFQFMNRAFQERLLQFIASEQNTLVTRLDTLSLDAGLFHKQLRKLTDPVEQALLRLHLMQGRLRKTVPQSSILIELNEHGKAYRVALPWMSSAFSVDSSVREAVRLRLFQEGVLDPTQEGVSLKPELQKLFEEGQTESIILSGNFQRAEKITIRLGTKSATQPFDIYVFEDEWTLVHRDGFQVTMSGARKHDDHYAHHLEHDLFKPLHSRPLKGGALSFFRLFSEGAVLALPSGSSWALEKFGKNLISLGAAVEASLSVYEGLGLSRSFLFLHDLKDEEFARACWLLEALFFKGVPLEQAARGFMLASVAESDDDRLTTREVFMSIPLALNIKDTGVIVWIDCSAEVFLYDDSLCGLRILKQQSLAKIEKHARFKKSQFPELWISKEWPGIPIGSGQEGLQMSENEESNAFEALMYSETDVAAGPAAV